MTNQKKDKFEKRKSETDTSEKETFEEMTHLKKKKHSEKGQS